MLRLSLYGPLALLFLASVLPSHAQNAGAAAGGAERRVVVAAGAPLTVECALRVEQRADWRLDGRTPPADMRAAEGPATSGAGGAVVARLAVEAARAHHAGVYTCGAGAGADRVRVLLTPGTEAVTESGAGGGEASAAVAAGAVVVGDVSVVYEVRGNLSLDCSGLATDAATIVWRINGTALEELGEAQRARYKAGGARATLAVDGRAAEDDFGNYSCAAGPAGPERTFAVRARTHAKVPANSNVVEGQKLKLTCKLVGKPYPAVVWTYSNTSETVVNGTEVRAALGPRATLRPNDQGVPDAELVIDPAQRSDAGWYMCAPVSAAGEGVPDVTTLRVKDMYAALWPFLGICAEVFVLCAVILVYEKRRTKPELDDSDTDNHDQKKS